MLRLGLGLGQAAAQTPPKVAPFPLAQQQQQPSCLRRRRVAGWARLGAGGDRAAGHVQPLRQALPGFPSRLSREGLGCSNAISLDQSQARVEEGRANGGAERTTTTTSRRIVICFTLKINKSMEALCFVQSPPIIFKCHAFFPCALTPPLRAQS